MNEFLDFIWLFIYSVRVSLICWWLGGFFILSFLLAPNTQIFSSMCMTNDGMGYAQPAGAMHLLFP